MTQLDSSPQAAPIKQQPIIAPAERRLTVQSFGATDKGRKRPTNQDQFVAAQLTRTLQIEQSSLVQPGIRHADNSGHVFIVADGMGGANGGEHASALAIDSIEGFMLNALHWLLSLEGTPEQTVLHDFKTAIRQADAYVSAASRHDPSLRGMGTTLTMAYSVDSDLFVAHVGDSRCYLFRNGALMQLTRDHTLVQQMLENGLIGPEEAAHHQFRHVITNAVGGTHPGVHVEVHRAALQPGDAVLLCTDGITGMLGDEEIASVVRDFQSAQRVCEELITRGNDAGGHDNMSVILARYY